MLKSYSDPTISVSDILETYSISVSRLYTELQRSGIARRKQMPSVTSSLDQQARDEIVRLYEMEEKSPKWLAAKFGLNYAQVSVIIREAGRQLKIDRFAPVYMQTDTQEQFKTLYADATISVSEIMRRLDLSSHDFKRLIVELKIEPRGKGGGARSIPSDVAAMMPDYARRYERGESMAKLAKEAGIGLATMKVRIKKLRQQ